MKRRQFIADSVRLALGARTAVLLSGVVPLAALAASSSGVFDVREIRTLTVLTRAMFPHRDLDDRYYLDVVKQLSRQAADSGELLGLIRTGISMLDETAGSSWVDASLDRKLQALTVLQTQEFFAAIQNRTIDVLYRNPEVLTRLGYQGSSIEFGGYLQRGFDDIDWLPE